ncbi:hypothetical protein SteCoe_26199 [Stentor coeruleus]|uniref:Uncharacterized protein n=1 Tax=Stentor coeruleus TaxID=5963 RepID=A0A1R2BDU2_9CILI|nr:hypothetical protein SteCoe_26199 [Stentor coeruleus]
MKVYVVAFLMLSLVSASNQYSNLKTQVGESCVSLDNIEILIFDVNPWPPSTFTSSFTNIVFAINQPNTSVGIIAYAIVNNLQQWTYQYQVVNQIFPQYAVENLEYILLWPNVTGNYVAQITFQSINSPPNINACWAFSFSIGP